MYDERPCGTLYIRGRGEKIAFPNLSRGTYVLRNFLSVTFAPERLKKKDSPGFNGPESSAVREPYVFSANTRVTFGRVNIMGLENEKKVRETRYVFPRWGYGARTYAASNKKPKKRRRRRRRRLPPVYRTRARIIDTPRRVFRLRAIRPFSVRCSLAVDCPLTVSNQVLCSPRRGFPFVSCPSRLPEKPVHALLFIRTPLID